MSTVSKFSAERNQRILLDLVSKPGNDVCADCKARAPRWASHNLGIFLCVNCASIHRKIGTHVTKVKSLTMDSWTREQVEVMKSVGNIASNAKYNPDENRHPPPANREESERDSELEKYIRAKYEFKRFMANFIKANMDRNSGPLNDNFLPQSRQPPASLARNSSPLPPLPSPGNLPLTYSPVSSQKSGLDTTQASVHRSTLPLQPPVSHTPTTHTLTTHPSSIPPLSSQTTASSVTTPSQSPQPSPMHSVWNDIMSLAVPNTSSSMTPPLLQPSAQLTLIQNQSPAFYSPEVKASSGPLSLSSSSNTMVNTPFVQPQTNISTANHFQQSNSNIFLEQRHFAQSLASPSFSQVHPSPTVYGQHLQIYATSTYPHQVVHLASSQGIANFSPQMPLQANQFETSGQPSQFPGQCHYGANPWSPM